VLKAPGANGTCKGSGLTPGPFFSVPAALAVRYYVISGSSVGERAPRRYVDRAAGSEVAGVRLLGLSDSRLHAAGR
jgi:hypothetical protein